MMANLSTISLHLTQVSGTLCLLFLIIWLANNAWEEKKAQGTLPPPMYSHSASLIGNKLFVFGGTDGSKYYNHVYVLDLGKVYFNFLSHNLDRKLYMESACS